MLNTLGPADWQISADVESAVEHRVRTVAGRAAHATVHVQLTVHCDRVDVDVTSNDPQAAGERVQLRPRRPFAGTIECTLPAPN